MADTWKTPTKKENQELYLAFAASSEHLFKKSAVIWDEDDVRKFFCFVYSMKFALLTLAHMIPFMYLLGTRWTDHHMNSLLCFMMWA